MPRVLDKTNIDCSTSATNRAGYSLWLSPTSEETVLNDLILSLSRRSNPTTIPFAPHVTLYADSLIPPHLTLNEIISRTARAAKNATASASGVTCKFEKVEDGKQFFQCVYVRLLKGDSLGLIPLHCALREAFDNEDDPAGQSYFPHFSLVYGNLEADQKQALIASMREQGELTAMQDGRELVAGLAEFHASEIRIVKTQGRSGRMGSRSPNTYRLRTGALEPRGSVTSANNFHSNRS